MGWFGDAVNAVEHFFGFGDDEKKPAAPPTTTTPDGGGSGASGGQQAPNPLLSGYGADGDPYKAAAKRIDAKYANTVPDDVNSGPAKLDTPEGRQAAMNKMVQNDPTDTSGDDKCGPTSILAGAILAGGTDGAKAIMADIQKNRPPGSKPDPDIKALQERLAKGGELTMTDLHVIQGSLYDSMKSTEKRDPDLNDGVKNQSGLDGKTIQDFISKDPALAKMFKDNHMEIDYEDTTGNGKGNHFVLGMRNDKSDLTGIYDPYLRKDGNQMVKDPNDIHDYDLARKLALQPQDRLLGS
jgi:hypothetical protein